MNGNGDKKGEQLTRFVQAQMKKHGVPGVSMAIYDSGAVYSGGFGVTSVDAIRIVQESVRGE